VDCRISLFYFSYFRAFVIAFFEFRLTPLTLAATPPMMVSLPGIRAGYPPFVSLW
jgi:hypothetical protein